MKIKIIKQLKGKTATFKLLDVEIGGKHYLKNILQHPRSVAILPVIDRDKIVLIKQFRFAINREIWEIPAGKLNKNEKPDDGAKRELREETGYRSKELKKIGEFYLSPGYSTEYMYVFLAKGLKKAKQSLEDGEQITDVKVFSVNEVLKMIKSRKIVDAKTLLALSFSGLT